MGYFDSQRPELLSYYGPALGRVLELGCADGRHGALLLQRGIASSVDGVELDHDAYAKAVGCLTNAIEGDVVDFVSTSDLSMYDTVLAHDVLEHLVDPWLVAGTLSARLKPGARIFASLPNVRFIKVVFDLACRGRFRYQPSGILDHTHLRFFTRESIEQLASGADLTVVELARLRYANQRWWVKRAVPVLRDLGCRQFLLVATVEGGGDSPTSPDRSGSVEP